MVQMIRHGGTCCGVTHMYLQGHKKPTVMMESCEKLSWGKKNLRTTGRAQAGYTAQQAAGEVPPISSYFYTLPAFTLDRPSETVGDRAEALLDGYMKTARTSGIIEVVVTHLQRPGWHEWLIAHGFVETVNAINSNSRNRITVYLLPYENGVPRSDPPAKTAPPRHARVDNPFA